MMSLLFFSVIYGLVTLYDSTTENGGLFLSEYLTLKHDNKEEFTTYDKDIYVSKMENAKVKDGLYRRDKTRTERTVSHDEITGMIVASKLLGTTHADEIWDYLIRHCFIYDFNYSRPYPAFHPAWIYFWGEWMDSYWTKIFYPLAFTNIYLATKDGSQGQTSGKLLYFTLLKRDSFLWQFYKVRMKKLYGDEWVKSVFSIYFSKEEENHPLIYHSRRYKYD